uniref:Uncharacterized protein n=1 Tax=Glossina brevipalpis TaxID=37001 RepID=A0A1A9W0B7_9MUSC
MYGNVKSPWLIIAAETERMREKNGKRVKETVDKCEIRIIVLVKAYTQSASSYANVCKKQHTNVYKRGCIDCEYKLPLVKVLMAVIVYVKGGNGFVVAFTLLVLLVYMHRYTCTRSHNLKLIAILLPLHDSFTPSYIFSFLTR